MKAACIAIPGLATHRYAALCALAPSLVYWPSSIGKEALMILGIGIATFGIAKFFSTGAVLWPLVMTAAALAFTGAIRPHIVGIWLAGRLPGAARHVRERIRAPRRRSRAGAIARRRCSS